MTTHRITFAVGDTRYSTFDGHGMLSKFTVETNYSIKEIQQAIRNCPVMDQYHLEAMEYLSDRYSKKFNELLERHGLRDRSIDQDITPHNHMHVFFKIVKLHLPDLIWKEDQEGYDIHLGGYGLFTP